MPLIQVRMAFFRIFGELFWSHGGYVRISDPAVERRGLQARGRAILSSGRRVLAGRFTYRRGMRSFRKDQRWGLEAGTTYEKRGRKVLVDSSHV